MRQILATTALVALFAAPAFAGNWDVDQSQSKITFEASQSGEAFTGTLPAFNADITFSPADLEHAKVSVVMPLAGLSTGSATRDADLPGTEWFDMTKHPEAKFESSSFKATGENTYVADGMLTIRGISQPLSLPFTLTPAGDATLMTSEVKFNRLPFEVGKSWPESSGVSENVTVKVSLHAKPALQAATPVKVDVPAHDQPISLNPEPAPAQ